MKAFMLLSLLSLPAMATEICLDPVKDGLDAMMEAVDCERLDRGLTLPGNRYLYEGLLRGKAALNTCIENGKVHKGMKFPLKAVEYFEANAIDCENEYKNVQTVIAKGHHLLSSQYSDIATMESKVPDDLKNPPSNLDAWKIKNLHHDKDQKFIYQKLTKPESTVRYFEQMDKAFCLSYLENKKLDETAMAGCNEELKDLKVASPTIECGSKVSSAQSIMIDLEKTIRGPMSCSQKADKIKALFKTAKLNNLDDLVIMNYYAQNIQKIISDPKKRLHLGATLAAANPIPLGADETVGKAFYQFDEKASQGQYNSTVINQRLALIAVQNDVMKTSDITRSADFCKSSQKEELLIKATNAFLDLDSPEKILAKSREFSLKCDKKIASIFGNEDTVAATCGHDHVGKSGGLDRSHTFINAHFYPNKDGKGTGPLYAPKGMTSMKLIPGMASQGCYKLEYAKGIGDLKGSYLIDFCHTGKPATGRSIASLPKNDRGSSLIGTLAGVGGASHEDNYNHSHLQLRNAKGRVNFVDAFCRNTEE